MDHNEKDIKSVMEHLLNSNKKLSKAYNSFNVEQVWRDTFGSMISQYTTEVRFSKGHLTIYLSSAALKQELDLNKSTIIERMNAAMKYNKVTSVRIC